MKRSHINSILGEFKQLISDHRWELPPWAMWTAQEYVQNPELAKWLRAHQMGWDVTDFGAGRFDQRGLALFCLRNGIQSDRSSAPYAEKLMMVGEGQETPFHTHKVKLEDIINRGGGDLMIEFRNAPGETDQIFVRCDGMPYHLDPDQPVTLHPGQSVTVPRGLYHRFYARVGGGKVLAGEVSQVNDDGADNYFWEDMPRFSDIDEDAVAIHPLWNEVGA